MDDRKYGWVTLWRLRKTYYVSDEAPSGVFRFLPVGSKSPHLKFVGDRVQDPKSVSWHWEHYFAGKKWQVHRLVWTLAFGHIPEGLIVDHQDGNRLNNRLGNLRLVTTAVNNRNRRLSARNVSGIAGVRFDKGAVAWVASWTQLDGAQKSKRFSVAAYGEDEAREMAIAERQARMADLQDAGAGYSDRHLGLSGDNAARPYYEPTDEQWRLWNAFYVGGHFTASPRRGLPPLLQYPFHRPDLWEPLLRWMKYGGAKCPMTDDLPGDF